MLDKGIILDEFGTKVGSYWWREGQNTFSFIWCKIRYNGYTEEGLINWADRLGLYLKEC